MIDKAIPRDVKRTKMRAVSLMAHRLAAELQEETLRGEAARIEDWAEIESEFSKLTGLEVLELVISSRVEGFTIPRI